jgi:uncharacterized lipoprotein YmbA
VRIKILIPFALICGGCSSVPVKYYTLIPPAASSSEAPVSACCRVELRSVRIPSAVDRQELVIRRSDEQLTVLSNDLWVAPLSEEVRSALLNDIEEHLPPAQPGQGMSTPKFVIFVDVIRFEAEPAKRALIEAEWRVEPAGAAKSSAPICKALAQVEVAEGISGLVQGYQHAISKVASSITLNVVAAEQGGRFECPSSQPAV